MAVIGVSVSHGHGVISLVSTSWVVVALQSGSNEGNMLLLMVRMVMARGISSHSLELADDHVVVNVGSKVVCNLRGRAARSKLPVVLLKGTDGVLLTGHRLLVRRFLVRLFSQIRCAKVKMGRLVSLDGAGFLATGRRLVLG